jgi:hypothetical protein
VQAEAEVQFWRAALWWVPPLALALLLGALWLADGCPALDAVYRGLGPIDIVAFVGVVLFVMDAFYYAQMKVYQAMARTSQGWLQAPGIVEASQMDETRRSSGRSTTTFYSLAVHYRYQVASQTYEGNRLAFGPELFANRDFVDSLRKKYQPDTTVTVHYDPNDPANSVLETSQTAANSMRFGLCAVLLASFGLIILAAICRTGNG